MRRKNNWTLSMLQSASTYFLPFFLHNTVFVITILLSSSLAANSSKNQLMSMYSVKPMPHGICFLKHNSIKCLFLDFLHPIHTHTHTHAHTYTSAQTYKRDILRLEDYCLLYRLNYMCGFYPIVWPA